MVTRPGAASYEQEAQATRELWAGLQTAGFEPLRVKIESTPQRQKFPSSPVPDSISSTTSSCGWMPGPTCRSWLGWPSRTARTCRGTPAEFWPTAPTSDS